MKTFIEIGSNNYDTLLYLAKNYFWKGIIVEPIPEVFACIERHQNCFYENCAISENDGAKDFFYYSQITGWGSLDRKHVEKLGIDKNKLNVIKVKNLTFDSLCSKYKLSKIDLLKIDTESYDGKIIKSIDFIKYDIKEIIFEYEHLSKKELNATQDYLIKNNYKEFKRNENNLFYIKS